MIESKIIQELGRLQDLIGRQLEKSKTYQEQRFTVSEAKEKDMFLGSLAGRIDRLTRFQGQDAESPAQRKLDEFEHITGIVERAVNSTAFSGQRAEMKVLPTG